MISFYSLVSVKAYIMYKNHWSASPLCRMTYSPSGILNTCSAVCSTLNVMIILLHWHWTESCFLSLLITKKKKPLKKCTRHHECQSVGPLSVSHIQGADFRKLGWRVFCTYTSMFHTVESLVFVLNVYLNKCAMYLLLCDIKPNQNKLLLAVHVRPFPDCVQGNDFKHWHHHYRISSDYGHLSRAPTSCWPDVVAFSLESHPEDPCVRLNDLTGAVKWDYGAQTKCTQQHLTQSKQVLMAHCHELFQLFCIF